MRRKQKEKFNLVHDKLRFCAAKKHKESRVIPITADVCRISVTWSFSLSGLHAFSFICAITPGRSPPTIFTFICYPSCYHLPPSIHQQPMLSKTIRLHSSSSITSPLSAERGHHYYCMSSFSVPLFSSVHPLLPGATVIMAVGDSGLTGWLLQLPCQPWVASSIMRLCLSIVCAFPACVICFVTICEHTVTSYHRAIWDAEECLHQPVSARLRERLSATVLLLPLLLLLLLLFWCRSPARSIFEFSHYSAR